MGFLTRCKRLFSFAFLLQNRNTFFSFFLKSFLILSEKQQPLRIVLAETFRLTEWGYYIAYYTDRRQALEDLNGRVAASVQYLRAGDAASFADSIADCYRHVLKRAKVYMLENYNFYKAASVRIPEKY